MEKLSTILKFYNLTDSDFSVLPDDIVCCGVDHDGKMSLLLSDGCGTSMNSLDVKVSPSDIDARETLDSINGEIPLVGTFNTSAEEALTFVRPRSEQYGSERESFDTSMSDIVHSSESSSDSDNNSGVS